MSRPFDEARYQALLDGLEVSEVKLSELERTKRLDAEYYRPAFLSLLKIQNEKSKKTDTLINLCDKIDVGFVGSMVHAYADETGIPLLQTQNIKQFFIDTSNLKYIQSWFHDELKKSQIFPGDILIARSGSIGNATVVSKSDLQPLNSSDIIIIRPKNSLNEYYLCAYINSKFGQVQIERLSSGGVQGHINLGALETVIVSVPTPEFQSEIEKAVKKARAKLEQSKRLYVEAEETLLEELGLKNWRPPKESTAVKTFKESFGKSGRLDAEYYQPKYDKLFAQLQKTKQAIRLGDWLEEPIKRGTQPEYIDDGEIPVINSQHVGKTKIELEDNPHTSKEFAKENERAVVRKYDVLLNSTGYITIGRCQTLLEDITAVVDGHVAVIRPKKGLDPVFLGLYLNALPGQMQTEQGWTGSSGQIELRRDIVENYIVWKPDIKIQTKIHKLVENAYFAEQESKRLLEMSKRAVEMSIERGESAGMKVLEGR